MHRLKKIITSRFPQPEHALNTIHIHQDRILNNLKKLQERTQHKTIFPVLKANAYGHGLKQISTILKTTDVPYICVDSFPEYQIVKDYAAKKCLIMGETHGENYTYYDPRRATVVIYNTDTLKSLIAT
jgi:alanine racemase